MTREASKDLDLNNINGEKKFIERLKPFFSNITNNLSKNLYLQRLSVNFGINDFVLEESLKNISVETSKRKKRKDRGNQKVQYKKLKEDLNIALEEQTLMYILEFYDSERKKCEELLNKKFSYSLFNELIEKLKPVNFNIVQLGENDINEESREVLTRLKLQADKDIIHKDKYYIEVYSGWFEREIKEESQKLEEENNKIKKIELKKILLKLESIKNINKFNEIEKLYDEFILIRRLGYV